MVNDSNLEQKFAELFNGDHGYYFKTE